ncbi:hypothetical protein AYL99_11718 [Fonsecaea erecta]|uniref:Retrotransposon gag domain-containing protein n=1 Tax=Fonsecaea erecta TaxID=1367422 RepID=A0A178Z4R8_9EURO|nr:hypothetical protein AYL99_11718 [Fonsecaea erecta]OAP54183.1 hypothetical protein AYL99_11718 [Fonsecaea erecta]
MSSASFSDFSKLSISVRAVAILPSHPLAYPIDRLQTRAVGLAVVDGLGDGKEHRGVGCAPAAHTHGRRLSGGRFNTSQSSRAHRNSVHQHLRRNSILHAPNNFAICVVQDLGTGSQRMSRLKDASGLAKLTANQHPPADLATRAQLQPHQTPVPQLDVIPSTPRSPQPQSPMSSVRRSEALPPVDQGDIRLAYSLGQYLYKRATFSRRQSITSHQTRIEFIVNRYSLQDGHPDQYAADAEPTYPDSWVTNITALREACQALARHTSNLNHLLREGTPAPSAATQDIDRERTEEVQRQESPIHMRNTQEGSGESPFNQAQQQWLDYFTDRVISATVRRALAQSTNPNTQPREPQPFGQTGPSRGPPASYPPQGTPIGERIRPADIGFFYPNAPSEWGGDTTITKDDKTYYRSVQAFVSRVQALAVTRSPAAIRLTLESCLRGEAESWWTNELDNVMRVGIVQSPDGVEEWCKALEDRFKESPSDALNRLNSFKYTIFDAQKRKSPIAYMAEVISAARACGYDNEYSMVLFAWNEIDIQLRESIDEPGPGTTVATFMDTLRQKHANWFDKAT